MATRQRTTSSKAGSAISPVVAFLLIVIGACSRGDPPVDAAGAGAARAPVATVVDVRGPIDPPPSTARSAPRVRRVSSALATMVSVLGRAPWFLKNVADSLFYWPDGRTYATADEYGLDAEVVHFAANGGPRLHGWWVPATSPARGTVVYCHGNHANITHHARFVSWLPARGFNLLIFDYRGFGESEGIMSREGAVTDAVAAIDFALERDPERTFVFGHSLGSALGLVAASRRPAVRAIIAESTFPSYRDAARCIAIALGPLVSLMVSKGEDPIDAVGAVSPRPLLVIAGGVDKITPPELGRSLFDAACEPKQWRLFAASAHATPWVLEADRFEVEVCAFFDDALTLR